MSADERLLLKKTPIRKNYGLIILITVILFAAIVGSLLALKGRKDNLLSVQNANGSIQSPVLQSPAVSGVPQPGLIQANAANSTGSGVLQGAVPNPPSAGVLQSDAPYPPSAGVLQAPSSNPPSAGVLQAQAPNPQAPAVMKSEPLAPPRKAGPPADVVAYLDHVRRVEEYRQSMRLDLSPAMDMLTDAYSLRTENDEGAANQTRQSINSGYTKYTSDWRQILAYFDSVPAPESCRSLAVAYGDALDKYSSIMITIQRCLNTKDISTLMGLQGRAQKSVDSSLRKADAQVSAVCKTFEIEKTFTVEPDQGENSLLTTGL
ncbi:MAG: hypothetical protein ACYC0V_03665 [Armatimonadota bacterium]